MPVWWGGTGDREGQVLMSRHWCKRTGMWAGLVREALGSMQLMPAAGTFAWAALLCPAAVTPSEGPRASLVLR